MAGHGKWASIERRTTAQDARRGKVFTNIVQYVYTSADFSEEVLTWRSQ